MIEEAQTVADLEALSRDIGRLRNGESTSVVAAWLWSGSFVAPT